MSDLTTAGIGISKSAACAAALAACFTGLDWISLCGATAGALLATFEDDQRTTLRLLLQAVCIVMLSMMAVWFIADVTPALLVHFSSPDFTLGRGRGFVGALFAYFAQRKILPGLGRLITWALSLSGRVGP